jgi:type II secretory pathway pseudopilin PulG
MARVKNKKVGMSMVEILGAVAVVSTLASLAVVSVKDSVQAGQRSAVQRELQTLNSAWNSFKAAGGKIEPDSSAEDAIRSMREGVKVSDTENYTPLTEDPDWLKEIGGETYRLEYDDETGFAYTPDGEGVSFTDAGAERRSQGFGGYPFDPQDRDAAMAALDSLAGMDAGDPAADSLLAAVNAAHLLGALTDADMLAAGMSNYNGTWMPTAQAQQNFAQDAMQILSGGGTWVGLSSAQKSAYANLYPEAAVQAGRADALNVMDPTLLNNQLVQGFAKINGQWDEPAVRLNSSNYAHYLPPATSTDQPQYLYIQNPTDHLAPPIYIGKLNPVLYTAGDPGDSWQWHNTYAWLFEGSDLGVALRNSHELAQARLSEGLITYAEYESIRSQRPQIGVIANVQDGSFDGVYNMGFPDTTRHVILSSSGPGQENLDLDP